jgi:hypothetical protein
LPELPAPDKSYGEKTISLPKESLSKFTGVYNRPNTNAPILVTLKDGKLYGDFYYRPGPLELVPLSSNEFELKETDAQVSFKQNNKGIVTTLIFHIGGEDMPAEKAAK